MPRICELRRPAYFFQRICDALRSAEVAGRCSRCHHRLRWAFLLRNSLSGDMIEVGRCCAKRLCDADCDILESEAKNRESRLLAFLDPSKWRVSQNGNPTRLVGKLKKRRRQTRVTVFQSRYGQWSYSVIQPGQASVLGTEWYSTEEESKIAAFNWLEIGREAE